MIVPRDDGGPAPRHVSENFPGVALLGAAIRKLPADVPVVLFVPPAYHTMLPRAGSLAAAEEAACKSALKKLVAGRPRSNFIDFRVDNALTRDAANFMDFGHYRAVIARRMEVAIAESIKLGDKAKIEFLIRPLSLLPSDNPACLRATACASGCAGSCRWWSWAGSAAGSARYGARTPRAGRSTASRMSPGDLVRIDAVARGALDLLHDDECSSPRSSGTENTAPPFWRSAGCARSTVSSMSCG